MSDDKPKRPEILVSRTRTEFEKLVASAPDNIREALKQGAAERDAAEANSPPPALDPNVNYT